MTKIGNKDISLAYNFLNLPGGKGAGDDTGVTTPAWTYSANGAKLKYENKDYIDGIEYKDGELYCIHHAEGRIYPKEQTDAEIANNVPLEWEHNFYLRDHLGNTRIVLNGAGIPIQENNYYPFGMNIENIDAIPDNVSRDSRYTYNGKEMNEDLGWLDYGARFYDPSICRFAQVDPLASVYSSTSSYAYVLNNPMRLIDPTGMSSEDALFSAAKNAPGAKYVTDRFIDKESGETLTSDEKVDKDLKSKNIDPNAKAPMTKESIEVVESLDGIKDLIDKGAEAKDVILNDSEGVAKTSKGVMNLYSNNFESWRILATTYGHELVHILNVNLYWNELFDAGYIYDGKLPSQYNELLAHSWSAEYSGIASRAPAHFRSESIRLYPGLVERFFEKHRIRPK